jgi:hypothetical protein
MKTALVICSILVGTAANAINCRVPPSRYDHEPRHSYSVTVDPGLCGNAFTSPDRTTIILPSPSCTSAAWMHCYLRHEKGHVNGWAGHHPGMRMSRR